MQAQVDSSFRPRASGWTLILAIITATLTGAGCSSKSDSSSSDSADSQFSASAADADLLMRVRFAGTAALMANAQAAYLTNIAALPETAALGERIAERFAGLPTQLASEGTTARARGALAPMFKELLKNGFVLELRGHDGEVTGMALGARADSRKATMWNGMLAAAAAEWFAVRPPKELPASWAAGNGRMHVVSSNGIVMLRLSRAQGKLPSYLKSESFAPMATNILEVELAAGLVPETIQRSAYGGFSRFQFEVTPDNQSLKIRGAANYASELPEIGGKLIVPVDLIPGDMLSFTCIRNPEFWLPPESAIHRFLPISSKTPLFFWGSSIAPFAFHAAAPTQGTKNPEEFMTLLANQVRLLANSVGTGNVIEKTDAPGFVWGGMPFVQPDASIDESDGKQYFRMGLAPQMESTNQIAPELVDRVKTSPNLVVYDWEFTGPKTTGWLFVSQLALMLSKHAQLDQQSASILWLQAISSILPDGGNTVTEISQTGPRELSLARRAPVGFTSIELLWLANWLESDNFPAANFLTPAPENALGEK